MDDATPYDLSHERALLGACIIDRDAISVVRDLVSIEDFYLEKHAQIYTGLLNLVERRIPPDLVTLAGELRERGQLELVGGAAFIAELASETPAGGMHVEHYAQRIIQTSAQRRVVELGAQIQIRARQGGDVAALFEELSVMMEVTKQASTPRSNWAEAVAPGRLLYRQKFEQEPFIVDKVLPQGTFLLTGKPKTRKSWLALNFGMAVAAGGRALGQYQAAQGDVLYIDLEMGAKRIHKRLHVVSPDEEPPRGLHFATSWPRMGEGFESWLRDYLQARPFTRLVVVDTLVGIRPRRARYEDPYESDKNFTQTLTNLCQQYRIAMLLIHHSRKADGSDITDDASGSTGLTGGVDNYAALRLVRGEKAAGELLITGRDIEIDGDLDLKWDARLAQWNAVEREATMTPERRDVLGLLSDRPGLTYKQIALILKRPEDGTKRLLSDMKAAGLLFNSGGGWFTQEAEE